MDSNLVRLTWLAIAIALLIELATVAQPDWLAMGLMMVFGLALSAWLAYTEGTNGGADYE